MSDSNGFVGADAFAATRRYLEDTVPTLGAVRIQSLSEAERAEWEMEFTDDRGMPTEYGLRTLRVRLIVRCLVDARGYRTIHDSQVDALLQADSAVIGRVFELCRDHCNIASDDIEKIEDLAKNSPGGRGEDSHISSRGNAEESTLTECSTN